MPFSASTCVPHLELCKSRINVKLSHTYMMSWAYVADLFNVVIGQKRRQESLTLIKTDINYNFYTRFAKLQEKVNAAMESLTYFTTNEWTCDTNNVVSLLTTLSPADSEKFNFDLRNIPWDDYIFGYGVGIRQYIMKDELATVPAARNRVKKYEFLVLFVSKFCRFVILCLVLLGLSGSIWRSHLRSLRFCCTLSCLTTWATSTSCLQNCRATPPPTASSPLRISSVATEKTCNWVPSCDSPPCVNSELFLFCIQSFPPVN